MNEDFATKAWADNHAVMSTGVHRAMQNLMKALKVLSARQFDAPWRLPACQKDCQTN